MTQYLLDVNVLIALIDPAHIQHDKAHNWFGKVGRRSWATCPLTENGVVRILGSNRYPGSPGTPAAIAEMMRAFTAHPGHEFWPDSVSLLRSANVQTKRLLHSAQITDTYLLALAASRNGKLVTFDTQIVIDSVVAGASALQVL